ncbi:MAG: site-specific DNA-methyltransferase [Treponema sp.]|nr:site-specific DNA-methyltransferase [Treponema sp.]
MKCVYIDPPYNTGSAFEHYDDNMGHTIWLSMMYPRLKLLKQFLREDGVIFIQFDDNEQAYAKVICDEIFGRNNLFTQPQSDTNTSGIDTSKFVIAGANPSKSLPPPQKPLYLLPPFIEFFVIVPQMNPVPLRRYHRFIPRLPRRNPRPPPSYALSVNRETLCSRVPTASGSARPSAASRRPEGGRLSIPRRYRAYLRVPSSPAFPYPPSDVFFRSTRVRMDFDRR